MWSAKGPHYLHLNLVGGDDERWEMRMSMGDISFRFLAPARNDGEGLL